MYNQEGMNYELSQDENLADGIMRILTECVDSVYELMTDPQPTPEDAVHNARKTFKRIRAALRLVRDETGTEWYRRENAFFRDASRILAPVRDSTVLVLSLDDAIEAEAGMVPADRYASIREKLVRRHEEIVTELLERRNVMDIVARRMEDARQRLDEMPVSSTLIDPIGQGLRRVYRQGRQAMELAFEDPDDPAKFHEWRKQVKYLWHLLEILAPTWPLILRDTAGQLHLLSDFLGDAHDMVVLKETLSTEPQLSAGEDDLAALYTLLDRRRRTLEEASRTLGMRLYCEKPSDFKARFVAYWHAWQQDPPATSEALQKSLEFKQQGSLLSTGETAELLAITPEQVRNAVEDGRLRGFKVGRFWAVDKDSLPGKVQRDEKPAERSLDEIIPAGGFLGVSLILRQDGRYLYGMRPARQKDGLQILELTGIGGKLEEDDQSLTAGAQREALEEIGCTVNLLPCPATIIVRGEDDIEWVSVRGEEQPAAVVFRYHRTPAHQPWHPENQGQGCLVVFSAEIVGRPHPSAELPHLIWLKAEQILETGRRDLLLSELLEDGAKMMGEDLPLPADHYVARLTDSQEAIVLALGEGASTFFRTTC
ncbi:MAG: CHAD domain-containing protein [Candidatus Promineifilaceae bacterium]